MFHIPNPFKHEQKDFQAPGPVSTEPPVIKAQTAEELVSQTPAPVAGKTAVGETVTVEQTPAPATESAETPPEAPVNPVGTATV